MEQREPVGQRGRDELNKLAAEAQVYQSQGQQLQQQLQSLVSTSAEIHASIEALKNLKQGSNKEVLIPLGSGVLLSAEVKNLEKVIVEVGAGISAEKTIDEAVAILEKRVKGVEETTEKIQKALSEVSSRLQQLDSRAKDLVSKLKSEG